MNKKSMLLISKNLWIVCAVALFPLFFQWFNNVEDSQMNQVLLGMFYSVAIGILLWLLAFLCFRTVSFATSICVLVLLVFWNYGIFKYIVQFFYTKAYYWHIVVVAIIFLATAVQIMMIIRKPVDFDTINIVIGVTFSTLIVMNIFPAVKSYFELSNSNANNAEQQTKTVIQENHSLTDLPDIHIFLFDEYSSDNFMSKYYQHNNTVFRESLIAKKFDYSMTSRYKMANTMYGIPSIMNMEYPTQISSELLESSKAGGRVFELFCQYGYETKAYSEGNEELLNDFNRILFDKSLVGPILSENSNYDQWAVRAKAYAEDAIARDYQTGPTPLLTFTYFNLPHSPYLFTEDGGRLPNNKVLDYINPAPYYGQYLYTQRVIGGIVDKIITDNPDSIIVLASDHSMRFMYTYHDITYPDYGQILNAVYYRGQGLPFVLEGLDGANTMRSIANSVLHTNLEMVRESDE